MARCIYCRNELTGDLGDLSRQASKEHIVPFALGGSDDFVTMDASTRYNNDLGSSIDAPFLNQLPIAMLRHQLKIKGQSGTIPPIVFAARSLDTNEPAHITISVDGDVDYDFTPVVIDDRKPTHTQRLIAGAPDKVQAILAGMLRKAKATGQSIYTLAGRRIVSADELPGMAEVEETSLFHASVVAMDATVWVRGLFKILLGFGHLTIGPDWTFSADGGDRLRAVLFCERQHWPQHAMKGFSAGTLPPAVAQMFGITPEIRAAKWHTLAILPRLDGGELVAAVSLFGGELPESLVTLGSERGRLAAPNDFMPPKARLGARINPRTREVQWITVEEALANTPL